MKRLFFLVLFPFLLSVLIIPPTSLTVNAQTDGSKEVRLFPSALQKGQSSSLVKDLQNILKRDSSIYPEGIVSGYYGSLTESAVKRLQKKYGLTETGVVDEATQSVIFPTKTEITVVSPNGGENWDKSETQSISWKVTIGPVVMDNKEVIPESSVGASQAKPSIAPFFPRASIDLIKDSYPSWSYHVDTVDLYQSQYQWRIPAKAKINEGNDYRVRISVGGDVPCLYRLEEENNEIFPPKPCPLYYPVYSASDASDNPFSIAGAASPSPDIIAKLQEAVKEMEQIISKLMSQIQLMKELLANF